MLTSRCREAIFKGSTAQKSIQLPVSVGIPRLIKQQGSKMSKKSHDEKRAFIKQHLICLDVHPCAPWLYRNHLEFSLVRVSPIQAEVSWYAKIVARMRSVGSTTWRYDAPHEGSRRLRCRCEQARGQQKCSGDGALDKH